MGANNTTLSSEGRNGILERLQESKVLIVGDQAVCLEYQLVVNDFGFGRRGGQVTKEGSSSFFFIMTQSSR